MHDAFPVVEIGVGPAVAQIDSNLVKNMTAELCVCVVLRCGLKTVQWHNVAVVCSIH